jgi:hypothetical protein
MILWIAGFMDFTRRKKTNSVAFSPQANYTDRGLPLAGEVGQLLWIEGCCAVNATDPHVP